MKRISKQNAHVCPAVDKKCLTKKHAEWYKATQKTYKVYVCPAGPHWHLSTGGHKNRITEPHYLCNKCGNEIRVKRAAHHNAKCVGFSSSTRDLQYEQ